VIPQEDVQALQEAIERLAGSPELRSQMGKRGREEAEKVYDTRSLAAKWLEVIQAAAGGTAGGGPRATECES
jgi:glycosyltransferase involved in cell wall biosynthesis